CSPLGAKIRTTGTHLPEDPDLFTALTAQCFSLHFWDKHGPLIFCSIYLMLLMTSKKRFLHVSGDFR
ncbi:MAG: hypothetical protein ACLQJ7_11235, partial [Syntrophobacteraceae bacterium]